LTTITLYFEIVLLNSRNDELLLDLSKGLIKGEKVFRLDFGAFTSFADNFELTTTHRMDMFVNQL